MRDEYDRDLQNLLGRADKAQAEAKRLLDELAKNQAELAAIQKQLADAASREAEARRPEETP